MWQEAAQITVICVLAIQMGLVKKVGEIIRYEFRVLSCPKCLVLWVSLGWHLLHSRPVIESVFASFVSSYAALWLCLFYDLIATGYNYAYEKINAEENDTSAAESSPDEVSELQ